MRKKVLIVEDDIDIANLVKLQLIDLDCDVDMAHDGLDGLALYKDNHNANQYALVILDIMLPGMDGLDICKAIRIMESYVPILMLTAKSTELDRVLGLELGADDYLTKPFSILELVARIKALFRRVDAMQTIAQNQQNLNIEQEKNEALIYLGDLELNPLARTLIVQGKNISLTAREFDLLIFFAQHPAQVFSRAQLLDKVWGYGHDGYEHTVNSHINRLRAKIEHNPAQPKYILTAWGVGYKFTEKI